MKEIDENLAGNDDDKQIAELLLRRTDAINRRERLIKAVENAIKLKYQQQIPEIFSAGNKAIKSRFVELQQQNSSIGRLIILMSALQNENQILNYLDLEEKKPAIDERVVHNKICAMNELKTARKLKKIMQQHAKNCFKRSLTSK